MDEQRFNHNDSVDADLRALHAAVTEFVSQLHVEPPCADEKPLPLQAPVNSTLRLPLQPKPAKLVIPVPAAPTTMAPSAEERRVRHWPLSLPTWRPGWPLLWGLPAVAIAGCIAIGVGWWLAGGPRVQVAAPRGLVVQTAQTPRSAVRTPPRSKAVARARKRARMVALPPVRRAPAARRPLPAPVPVGVPPLPPDSLATLSRPSVVPTVSDLVAPLSKPSAITPPGIVYQELPRAQVMVDQTVSVLLVILINQHGGVDRAFIGSTPVIPRYERQLLEAAKTWRYTPALQNGRAIPCRKTLRVTVPASRSRG